MRQSLSGESQHRVIPAPRYICGLACICLLFGVSALAQSSTTLSSAPPAVGLVGVSLDTYLDKQAYLVACTTVVVSIVVLVVAVWSAVQMLRADRMLRQCYDIEKQCREIRDRADAEIEKLKDRVRDHTPPGEILAQAREYADKAVQRSESTCHHMIDTRDSIVKPQLDRLAAAARKEEDWRKEMRSNLARVESQLKNRPTMNDLLVEADKKYTVPEDLSRTILQQVYKAFLCMTDDPGMSTNAVAEILLPPPGRVGCLSQDGDERQ